MLRFTNKNKIQNCSPILIHYNLQIFKQYKEEVAPPLIEHNNDYMDEDNYYTGKIMDLVCFDDKRNNSQI